MLPGQVVIDANYTGAKGTRLDTITAPGPLNQSFSLFFFDYQNSTAFSNFNALSVTATKRLQNGLALSLFIPVDLRALILDKRHRNSPRAFRPFTRVRELPIVGSLTVAVGCIPIVGYRRERLTVSNCI